MLTNLPLIHLNDSHIKKQLQHSFNIPDRPSSSFNFSSSSSSSINSFASASSFNQLTTKSELKKQNGVWWGILERKEENKSFNSTLDFRLSSINKQKYLNRSSSLALHRNGTFRQKGPAQKIISVKRPPIYYYLFKRNYIKLRAHKIQEEKAMLQAPTAPISAAKFVAYVQERRKKRILFKGEFLMIQRSVDPQRLTTEVGIRMGEKNQYPDTLPYDQNRVILEHRPGVEDSHYINASYVNSWLRERAYVVTQSVRNKQASNELWRCVWEIGANTIVMLTKIFDFMRVVCLQYWPQTQFQFGEIHVETLDTRTYAHFVIRTFRLRKTGGVGDLTTTSKDGKGETQKNINDNNNFEERIVKHFHFTEWELNSFPYISAFVEVRRRVRQWMERSPVDAPIVVHCRYLIFFLI
uniref:Tyrosine-protein phosphatase domain-containing protein n=1 Tax=Meloidogyne hapla TaxID=6305 RepID=A0A1I8BPD2_MELHA